MKRGELIHYLYTALTLANDVYGASYNVKKDIQSKLEIKNTPLIDGNCVIDRLVKPIDDARELAELLDEILKEIDTEI